MEIMTNIASDHDMSKEMMEKMKEKDNGMMMKKKDKDKGMMTKEMDHLVNMAANDSIVFNNMIEMMKEKPEMWKKAMKMKTATTKNN